MVHKWLLSFKGRVEGVDGFGAGALEEAPRAQVQSGKMGASEDSGAL